MRLLNLNAASQSQDEIVQLRVPREPQETEVRLGLEAGCNALIFGSRGAGKTFTLKALEVDLSSPGGRYLPTRISLFDVVYNKEDLRTLFPTYVLLSLCRVLWEANFAGKYSQLLHIAASNDAKLFDELNPEKKRFAQIYQALHARQFEARNSIKATLGAALVAKSELGTERSSSITRGGLLPFEFQALLHELMDVGLRGANRTPVVLCDEADLFGSREQQDFLAGCFEAFNAAGIRFVCSMGRFPSKQEFLVPEAFQVAVDLEGLETTGEIRQLVERHLREENVTFQPEALDVLREFFGGHPRHTLQACMLAASAARTDPGGACIDAPNMVKACLVQQRKHREWSLSPTEA